MKLQLLIPQFNETDDVMRPMLDSIRTQQGVDLKNDIEVIIGNDGSDTKLSEGLLGSFPFPSAMFCSTIPACRGPAAACSIWRRRITSCSVMPTTCS